MSLVDRSVLFLQNQQVSNHTHRHQRDIKALFFGYFHESYHVGQTELLRQLAGKNDKMI